jgi:hypothetical protein
MCIKEEIRNNGGKECLPSKQCDPFSLPEGKLINEGVRAEDDKKNIVFGGLPKYLQIQNFPDVLREEGISLDEASTSRINFCEYLRSKLCRKIIKDF